MDHFHFVELIAADHAPLFSAVGAGFLAVAGGVGEIFPREIIEIKDLVAVEVHQSGFGGGEEELLGFGPLKPKDIFLEFRELTGGIAGFVVEDMRREDHLIVVREVVLDEVIEQSPL